MKKIKDNSKAFEKINHQLENNTIITCPQNLNILFIMHMPPPIHGAAMMGKYIYDSELINTTFNCHYINLTTAKRLQDIGKGESINFGNLFACSSQLSKKLKE